jgi:hypothetical protein
MHELAFARSDLTAKQIVEFRLGMRSEVMELVAGTRDTLARSRLLLSEADAILALGKSACLGPKRSADVSAQRIRDDVIPLSFAQSR